MPSHVLAAVLLAAFLHAAWNALAKGREGGDPLVRAALITVGGAVAALPLALGAGLPDVASWPYLVASLVIHIFYFVLVGLTLSSADLGVVYPLTRGSAPLGVAAVGLLIGAEALSGLAWVGVALISTGIVAVGSDAIRARGLDSRSAALVVLNAAVIVSYLLIDGAGVRLSGNPPGYVGWLFLGTGLGVWPLVAWWRGAAARGEIVRSWRFTMAGGAMLTTSYGIALWAMTKAPVAAVSAVRETSVLFAALLGATFLGERLGPARLTGAMLIVAGLILVRIG